MKNVTKLSESELTRGGKSSWHDQYKDSAWIFVGGLPYDLTEGDIICVFSQYGEIVNINLVRDKASGKQKGFCFICYEDQRSTVLAVDNLNGIKVSTAFDVYTFFLFEVTKGRLLNLCANFFRFSRRFWANHFELITAETTSHQKIMKKWTTKHDNSIQRAVHQSHNLAPTK